MRDQNAQQLLAKVMNWQNEAEVSDYVPSIQLLADFKYDHYQRFGPGKRFVESLALWLNQFDPSDRSVALDFVRDKAHELGLPAVMLLNLGSQGGPTDGTSDLARKIEFVFSHPAEVAETVKRGQKIYLSHTWNHERLMLLNSISELL
jgi:hypothetical protein